MSNSSRQDTPTQSATFDWQSARQAVVQTRQELESSTAAEQAELAEELRSLTHALRKLEEGRLEVVVIGEIDTGKSALVNALLEQNVASVDVRGGWTRESLAVAWPQALAAGSPLQQVQLLDTPGLNEVEGSGRTLLAASAARTADLILFVTDSDLNHTEFAVLTELVAAHKPVFLVVNKLDLYSPAEAARLLQVLREERVQHLLRDTAVYGTVAAPRPREYLLEAADGTTKSEYRTPPPQVQELRQGVINLLAKEAGQLLAMSASLLAADVHDKLIKTRLMLREQQANTLIWSFATGKAIGVATVPAVLDILGGAAADVSLVGALAKLYGFNFSRYQTGRLVWAILQAAGWVAVTDLLTHLASSALKGVTWHGSSIITALPQGLVAGYGSLIVGQAAKYYFEHGASWGPGGPKQTVQAILAQLDRESVMNRLKEEITKRLERNQYGDSNTSPGATGTGSAEGSAGPEVATGSWFAWSRWRRR